MSSLQLSKELDVSQQTAWYMLHRLREACGDEALTLRAAAKLKGVVEVDETYLGGKEIQQVCVQAQPRQHRRRGQAVDCGNARAGRQGSRWHGARNRQANPANVGPDQRGEGYATVYTDEHSGYSKLSDYGYEHDSVTHSAKEFVKGMASTNGIESVWALLKRGFNGVYHHWSVKHCHRYVNEFSFRFERGELRARHG